MLPQIESIAKGMQFKIDKNARKPGWVKYDDKGNRIWGPGMLNFLRDKLREEVSELLEEVDTIGDPIDVFREACDVANIVMMIADVCGGIKASNLIRND